MSKQNEAMLNLWILKDFVTTRQKSVGLILIGSIGYVLEEVETNVLLEQQLKALTLYQLESIIMTQKRGNAQLVDVKGFCYNKTKISRLNLHRVFSASIKTTF